MVVVTEYRPPPSASAACHKSCLIANATRNVRGFVMHGKMLRGLDGADVVVKQRNTT